MMLMATTASAQENLHRGAIASQVKKSFTTIWTMPHTMCVCMATVRYQREARVIRVRSSAYFV